MTRRTRRAARAQASGDEWIKDLTDRPVDDLPEYQNVRFKRAATTALIWACLASLPVVAITGITTTQRVATVEGELAASARKDSSSKAVAQLAVEQWLASPGAPLVGGHLLSWDGATTTGTHKRETENTPPRTLETHILTVTDGTQVYMVGVQTATADDIGTIVLDTPSLLPTPAANQNAAGSVTPWPHLVRADSSKAVENAVESWGKALYSGDPVLLKQATRDAATDSAYMPLAGMRFIRSTIISAASRPEKPQTLTVRVSIAYSTRPADPAHGDTVSAQATATATYDLRVIDATGGTPTVTAWGAPGTGEQLTDYANRVTGREITVVTPSPRATPTLTPTPSTTGAPAP